MSKRVSKKATKKVAKRITKKPVNRVAKKRTRKAKPKAAPRGMGKLTARLPNWAQVGLEYFKQFAWRAALIMAVALLGFTVYLDIQIVKKFEGQKWALPAHVYTRPLELYTGLSMSQSLLIAELDELGYIARPNADRVGTFHITANSLTIFQREFQFWDGLRPAQRVEVSFTRQGNELLISTMTASANASASPENAVLTNQRIVRLEPRLFGSVSPMSHEDRALVELDDLPPQFAKTLVAVEDQQFYSHFGVNPFGIARAMLANIRAGSIVQGGSTLTQQLVKNYYLTRAQTYSRKLTEMIMAVLLEMHYSKDEILQTYINEVYLSQAGNRAIHGFGLASQHFFGQPISELEVDQMALLIGINNGPSYYNPIRHPERALTRRDLVLKMMLSEAVINQTEYRLAIDQPLRLNPSAQRAATLSYPSFMGFVRENLQSDYAQEDLNSVGLKIHTTLNPRIQSELEQAASKELNDVEQRHGIASGTLQMAAVVVRTDNGEVAGMIGDRSAKFSGFNRALQSKRPVGSLLKPFVYLTALEQPEKYSLATKVSDRAITVSQKGSPDWNPQNYDNQEHGDIMLIDALARSYNLATVQLGMAVGVSEVSKTIRRVGYAESFSELPSLLLGAVPMSVLDVSQIYLTLASDGFKTPIKGVRAVLSKEGEQIARYPLNIEQVIEPEFNALINYALQETVRTGTARGVSREFRYDYGLAGKTGTTDEYRDSWFAGYSGNYLTVVWIGRDDNQSTGLTGASGAARVWSKIMSNLPLERLTLPQHSEIVPQRIHYSLDPEQNDCSLTRQLPVLKRSIPLANVPCMYDMRYDDDQEAEPSKQEERHFEPRKKQSLWERIFG